MFAFVGRFSNSGEVLKVNRAAAHGEAVRVKGAVLTIDALFSLPA